MILLMIHPFQVHRFFYHGYTDIDPYDIDVNAVTDDDDTSRCRCCFVYCRFSFRTDTKSIYNNAVVLCIFQQFSDQWCYYDELEAWGRFRDGVI